MEGLRFFRAALFALAFCFAAAAQIKNVAIVETEADPQAAAGLTSAEVRQITVELRREAVNNLPQGKYNVMTLETLLARGGDSIIEWAEENRVVSLGSRIGADFIVRGIVSKIQAKFTLSVEIYDTEDGKLAGALEPVRSESVEGLLEKTTAACAKMYAAFVSVQNPPREMTDAEKKKAADAEKLRQKQIRAEQDAEMKREAELEKQRQKQKRAELDAAADANLKREAKSEKQRQKLKQAEMDAEVKKEAKLASIRRKESEAADKSKQRGARNKSESGKKKNASKIGVSLGLGRTDSAGGGRHAGFIQPGFVHTRPLLGNFLLFNVEGNFLAGTSDARFGEGAYTFYGNNVPVTCMLRLGAFSLEAGARGEIRYGGNNTDFDAGFAAGLALGPLKKSSWRYFYRYAGGFKYKTHAVGAQYMF